MISVTSGRGTPVQTIVGSGDPGAIGTVCSKRSTGQCVQLQTHCSAPLIANKRIRGAAICADQRRNLRCGIGGLRLTQLLAKPSDYAVGFVRCWPETVYEGAIEAVRVVRARADASLLGRRFRMPQLFFRGCGQGGARRRRRHCDGRRCPGLFRRRALKQVPRFEAPAESVEGLVASVAAELGGNTCRAPYRRSDRGAWGCVEVGAIKAASAARIQTISAPTRGMID
jgi:hypothetical protein